MKTLLAVLATTIVAVPLSAQEHPHAGQEEAPPTADHCAGHGANPAATDGHSGHGAHTQSADPRAARGEDDEAPAPPAGPPPKAAFSGPRHAADARFDPAVMADARRQLRSGHGGMRSFGLLVDRLEAPIGDAASDYAWEAQGWYGADTDRIRVKTEGEGTLEALETAELQALWSHAVTPWFDVQAGVRYDWRPEPDRGYLVLGVQGLLPYLLEFDAAAFVSEEGDASARIEAQYDLLVTQRFVLQPRAEVEFTLRDVPELAVGSGIGRVELGLRFRYEVAPELAPYAGIHWERRLGETADFARRAGASTNDLFMVAGVNFWF